MSISRDDLPILTTARLRLHPVARDDVDDWVDLDQDPEVVRYIYPNGPPDPAAHRARLQARFAAGWPDRGGIWNVFRPGSPELLGWCGLFPLPDTPYIEISYRYRQTAWGQGIATEAGRRVLEQGFDRFGFDPVTGVTHPDNHASMRVLEKLGLRRDGSLWAYGASAPFFRLYRHQWRAQEANGTGSAPGDG